MSTPLNNNFIITAILFSPSPPPPFDPFRVTDTWNCLGKLYFIAAAIKTNPQDVGLQSRNPWPTHTHILDPSDILCAYCHILHFYLEGSQLPQTVSCPPATSLSLLLSLSLSLLVLVSFPPARRHFPRFIPAPCHVYYLFTIFSYSK